MRSARTIFSLYLFFVLALPTFAQTPQRDPQAVSILTQSLALTHANAPAIQDNVTQGTITFADGTTGTITLKTKGQTELRNEINSSEGQTILVSNGGKGFVTSRGNKRSLPLWVTAYQRPMHLPVLSRMADYVNLQTKIVYIGLENVGGRPAHHIRLSTLPTDGTPPEVEDMISEFHVFIDAESMLLVKTLSFDFSPEIIENRSPVETLYSDYRMEDGMLAPHHLTRIVAGNKEIDITLTSFQFNVGLPDSDFQ